MLPVIGNFLSIWSLRPSTINPHSLRIWEYFDEWYKVYGDIFSVTAGKFSAGKQQSLKLLEHNKAYNNIP